MRSSLVIIALVAAVACKGDRDSSTAGESGQPTGTAPAQTSASSAPNRLPGTSETTGQAVFRTGDDSALGRALEQLAAVDAPRLDGDPACAKYAANVRTLMVDMSQTMRRLRERGKTGIGIDEIAAFAVWLDKRAGMLEHLGRARSMMEGDLAQRHRDFAAAAGELAAALSASYGSRDNELGTREVTRLQLASEAFAVATLALEEQCRG